MSQNSVKPSRKFATNAGDLLELQFSNCWFCHLWTRTGWEQYKREFALDWSNWSEFYTFHLGCFVHHDLSGVETLTELAFERANLTSSWFWAVPLNDFVLC